MEEDSPVDGNRLFVSLADLNSTMKIMASVMKNIQDQQGKQKSTEEIQGAAMQSLEQYEQSRGRSYEEPSLFGHKEDGPAIPEELEFHRQA